MNNGPFKDIRVSAPGNVMLMGEHAVLFGHRAIVCAVAQRMSATLEPIDEPKIYIESTLDNFECSLSDALNGSGPETLSFVMASIRAVHPKHGFKLTIESEFSHTVGLGSSATVTAVCVYALMLYTQGDAPLMQVFDLGLKAIHDVQKRGSGSDLAASVFGGIIGYTAKPRTITKLLEQNDLSAHTWPKLDLLYCGYKTPTPNVLAHVAKESKQFPKLYEALYAQMHNVCVQAEQAVIAQDWKALGQLMNMYHGFLDALGVSDAKLSELIYTAREFDDVLGAKISGSGLGDCIITLSNPNSHSVESMATQAHIDAHISPQGLILHD